MYRPEQISYSILRHFTLLDSQYLHHFTPSNQTDPPLLHRFTPLNKTIHTSFYALLTN